MPSSTSRTGSASIWLTSTSVNVPNTSSEAFSLRTAITRPTPDTRRGPLPCGRRYVGRSLNGHSSSPARRDGPLTSLATPESAPRSSARRGPDLPPLPLGCRHAWEAPPRAGAAPRHAGADRPGHMPRCIARCQASLEEPLLDEALSPTLHIFGRRALDLRAQ